MGHLHSWCVSHMKFKLDTPVCHYVSWALESILYPKGGSNDLACGVTSSIVYGLLNNSIFYLANGVINH